MLTFSLWSISLSTEVLTTTCEGWKGGIRIDHQDLLLQRHGLLIVWGSPANFFEHLWRLKSRARITHRTWWLLNQRGLWRDRVWQRRWDPHKSVVWPNEGALGYDKTGGNCWKHCRFQSGLYKSHVFLTKFYLQHSLVPVVWNTPQTSKICLHSRVSLPFFAI